MATNGYGNIDWNDPAARLALAESVGLTEFNRLMNENRRQSVVATVNGRAIWPTNSPFGTIYVVEGSSTAWSTLDEAKHHAAMLEQS